MLFRSRAGHTLDATALVHEAYLRLVDAQPHAWDGRRHFFAAAAEAMRRILVDRARRRMAAKRGAGEACLDADELEIPAPAPDEQLLEVSEALEKFANDFCMITWDVSSMQNNEEVLANSPAAAN